MLKYILKRILNLIPVLVIISMLIFATVQAMPGDPVNAYLGSSMKVTEEQREQLRHELGFDQPMPVQYVRWAGRMVTGDLGESAKLKEPVAEVIGDYVWNTFYLNVVSLIVALLFAIPIGIRQAVKKGSAFDNFWTVLSSSSMVHTLSSLQSGFLTILYIFLLLIAPISSKRFTIRYTVADPMPGSRRDAL